MANSAPSGALLGLIIRVNCLNLSATLNKQSKLEKKQQSSASTSCREGNPSDTWHKSLLAFLNWLLRRHIPLAGIKHAVHCALHSGAPWADVPARRRACPAGARFGQRKFNKNWLNLNKLAAWAAGEKHAMRMGINNGKQEGRRSKRNENGEREA